MGASVEFDDSDFVEKVYEFEINMQYKMLKAVNDIAYEILRLSQLEVPIDLGPLQNSGIVIEAKEISHPEAIVGYNKEYAAYQHEGHWPDGSHQVVHYTNPRSKPKYLEDPIRMNLAFFVRYLGVSMY